MAAKTPEESINDIRGDLKALRDDLVSLAGTVRDLGTQQAGSMAQNVRGAVGQAAEGMRMTAGEARRQGEIMASEMEAAITRHPLTSVLIALGLGYLVGLISRR
jgi:ElaB/YqjD/DUF883 family membrane-anchored ribosome-binding protein